MNGAQRAWAAGVRRIHEEADGVVILTVVQQADMSELIAHYASGDPDAVRLGLMVSQVLHGIMDAPRTKPMLCGSCSRPLRDGKFALAFAIPYLGRPREALSMAICERCGSDRDTIMEAAGQALRQLWPDLRHVDIHPVGGHA